MTGTARKRLITPTRKLCYNLLIWCCCDDAIFDSQMENPHHHSTGQFVLLKKSCGRKWKIYHETLNGLVILAAIS